MRIRSLSVMLFFAVAVWSARADVIFSGGGFATSATGSPCSAAGGGDGSLSVGCTTGDSLGIVSVQGSGDAYSGHLSVSSQQNAINDDLNQMVWVHANGELDLNETYVLVGGLGLATVNLNLTSNFGDPAMGDYYSCALVFNGVSQSCELAGGAWTTISEQVEYWVPFSIGLDVQMDTVAVNFGDLGQFGYFGYNFEQPGLFALPIPEPSSALLLLPGLAGVLFAARSRATCLLGGHS